MTCQAVVGRREDGQPILCGHPESEHYVNKLVKARHCQTCPSGATAHHAYQPPEPNTNINPFIKEFTSLTQMLAWLTCEGYYGSKKLEVVADPKTPLYRATVWL